MLALLRSLKEITATRRGLTRLGYSSQEDEAHELVWRRLARDGRYRRVDDAAGNMFILPADLASGQPAVLIGSHLDTVRNGGWLDGALGVAAGVVTLETSSSPASEKLGLVVFRDEEGVRFGNGLFGSRAFAGRVVPGELDLEDTSGTSLRSLLPGLEAETNYPRPVTAAAYLECHIEQGIRLETRGKRIGLVTGFVGIRRLDIRSRGEANHAGTTGMERRADALVPVADLVRRLPELVADQSDTVVTCGELSVSPGAPNVIPGEVNAVVEIRSLDPAVLDLVEGRVRSEAGNLGGNPLVRISIDRTSDIHPVPTDEEIMNLCDEVVRRHGCPAVALPSMAGHDAQALSGTCPVGMFFIPSIGGVSHSPAENSAVEDIEVAGELMREWASEVVSAMGLI